MKLVPIEQAYNLLAENTSDEVFKYQHLLKRWAIYIEGEMLVDVAKKPQIYKVDVVNQIAQFPETAYKILNVFPVQFEDKLAEFVTGSIGNAQDDPYEGEGWLISPDALQMPDLDFVIQEDSIFIPAGYDEVVLYALGLTRNQENQILVIDNHLPAIAAYLEYKLHHKFMYKTMRSSKRMYGNEYQVEAQLRREYGRLMRNAMVKDREYDSLQARKQIDRKTDLSKM